MHCKMPMGMAERDVELATLRTVAQSLSVHDRTEILQQNSYWDNKIFVDIFECRFAVTALHILQTSCDATFDVPRDGSSSICLAAGTSSNKFILYLRNFSLCFP